MEIVKVRITVSAECLEMVNTSKSVVNSIEEVLTPANVSGTNACDWLVENSSTLIKIFGTHVASFLIAECEAWCNHIDSTCFEDSDYEKNLNTFNVKFEHIK